MRVKSPFSLETCRGSRNFSYSSKRAPFATWNEADVQYFKDILQEEKQQQRVLTEKEDTKPFTIDWLKKYEAKSPHQLVLKPKTTGVVYQSNE
jgi:hypothetical protein